MSDRHEGLVIGNWKMNLDHVEAIHLTQQLGVLHRNTNIENVVTVLAPPFTDIRSVASVIEADRLPFQMGAQHVHHLEGGAFTGEISIPMLRRLGVKYIVVGHSERREYFGMTDAIVNQTLTAVVAAGLTAVVCVGESSTTREEGDAARFVRDQVGVALDRIKSKFASNVVVAYEPLWAIGTGAVPTGEQVAEMASTIRAAVPSDWEERTAVLYGGSVKPDNAELLMRNGDVDGFLVGGASLTADGFLQIVKVVSDCYSKKR